MLTLYTNLTISILVRLSLCFFAPVNTRLKTPSYRPAEKTTFHSWQNEIAVIGQVNLWPIVELLRVSCPKKWETSFFPKSSALHSTPNKWSLWPLTSNNEHMFVIEKHGDWARPSLQRVSQMWWITKRVRLKCCRQKRTRKRVLGRSSWSAGHLVLGLSTIRDAKKNKCLSCARGQARHRKR